MSLPVNYLDRDIEVTSFDIYETLLTYVRTNLLNRLLELVVL